MPPSDAQAQRPEPPKDDSKMKERRAEMEKAMKEYDTELQKIMTADQYKSYQEDQKKMRKRVHRPRRAE
jgi:DNA-binding IscR family transcriptional regulator